MQPRLLRAARAARLRRLTAFPALVLAGLAAAACGGGGDGPTGSGSQTTATFNVSATAALAQGTAGATVVVVPVYTPASGANVALTPQTASVTSGTVQASVPVNLAACLGTTGSCTVSAAVTLQAGGRTLDSTFVGPFTVRGGDTFAASVSLAEVASVQVTREGGAAVGGQPVVLTVGGQPLDLAAVAVGANGAALTRPVTWATSAGTVATVDGNGVITAVALGSARITASFAGRSASVDVAVQPTLAVTRAGDGAGTVTSAPAGINCGPASTACSGPFATGTTVTLTAAPDANSTFTGWSGDCSGTATTCTVPLGQNRAVTATFVVRRTVSLTVNVAGSGGTGDVLVTGTGVSPTTACAAASCTYTVVAGTEITLTARPSTGSAAGTWSGACSGAATQACKPNTTANLTVGVTFGPRPISDSVTVSAVTTASGGPYGGQLQVSGFVNGSPTTTSVSFTLSTASPSPASGLAFDPSSPVTLQFAPNAGSRTLSWGGLCASAAVNPTGVSTCTFTSTRNSQVTINLGP